MIPISFQLDVAKWMLATFGEEIASDRIERNHRFLEESLELVQANGCTKEEAHALVDYVFSRAVGERKQEVGGVMVTLAALCNTIDVDMFDAAAVELARCWLNIDKIRAKQATKPKHSPLPGYSKVPTERVVMPLYAYLRNEAKSLEQYLYSHNRVDPLTERLYKSVIDLMGVIAQQELAKGK